MFGSLSAIKYNMTNKIILDSLTKNTQDAFEFIEQHSLEIALAEEIKRLQDNEEADQAVALEFKLKEEKQHKHFLGMLQQFHQLDEKEIEEKFYRALLQTFEACSTNNKPTQAIFFEYESVDDAFAPAHGFGPTDYKVHLEPETVSYKLLIGKETFSRKGGIDFGPAWKPVASFSWLVWEFEVYYFTDMVRVFEFNSYCILHQAIDRAVKSESFTKLNIERPLYFYANEHDCGTYSIYVVE
jgi:hypothetical protein